MNDQGLYSIFKLISQAYPDKPIEEPTMILYQEELADIPLSLLERAVHQHIRISTYFPRISDIIQLAREMAGKAPYTIDSSPGLGTLSLEAHMLEQDYFEQGIFIIEKWEKLADQLDQVDRTCRAAELRQKAHHIQASLAAELREEQYPPPEICRRYRRRKKRRQPPKGTEVVGNTNEP